MTNTRTLTVELSEPDANTIQVSADHVDATQELTSDGWPVPPSQIRSPHEMDIANAVEHALTSTRGPLIACESKLWQNPDSFYWQEITYHKLHVFVQSFYGRTRFPVTNDEGETVWKPVSITQPKIKNVLKHLYARCFADSDPRFFKDASARGINFRNCFLKFDTQGGVEAVPHDRNHRCRYMLPIDWPEGKRWNDATLLPKLLNGCFEDRDDKADLIKLIGEIFGAAILGYSTRLAQPQAFLWLGPDGNNGKSQLVDAMCGLLPSYAVLKLNPGSFQDDGKFASLAGKLLNVAAELDTHQSVQSERFKQAVTGDEVSVRIPYAHEASPVYAQALQVFASNSFPTFAGGFDGALRRRLQCIKFTRVIPKRERIAEIGKRIVAEEMPYLAAFAIAGAQRLIRQGHYTEPASCREAMSEWLVTGDYVTAYLEDGSTVAWEGEVLNRVLYAGFKDWARDQGYHSARLPTQPAFLQRVHAYARAHGHPLEGGNGKLVGLRRL